MVRLADKDIRLCSILYFQGRLGGTQVHTDTEMLDLFVKLGEIEKNERITRFVKAHRRYYVNTAAIRFVHNNSVPLKNGETVPLSGKYRKNVEHEYVSRLYELY